MNLFIKIKNKAIFGVYLIIMFLIVILSDHAEASNYVNLKDTMTRTKISTLSSHSITFQLTDDERIEVGYNPVIDFGEDSGGFVVDGASTVINDFDFNDGTERTVLSSCVDGANNIAFSIDDPTGILTFTPCGSYEPSLPNANVIIKYGTSATGGVDRVTNPAIAGTYLIAIKHNAVSGTNIATVIVNEDKLNIDGTVEPMLIFSISSTAGLHFGDFIGTEIRYATDTLGGSLVEPVAGKPVSLFAGTNGQGGFTIYFYDQGSGTDSGLFANAISELIPAVPSSQVLSNTKTYGAYGKNASGLNIDAGFDNNGVGDLSVSRTPQELAGINTPLSAGSLDLVLKASTTAVTRAGLYSDTITLLCTGVY